VLAADSRARSAVDRGGGRSKGHGVGGQVVTAGSSPASDGRMHPGEAARATVVDSVPAGRAPSWRLPKGLVIAVAGSIVILIILEVLALRLIRAVAEDEALQQAGDITADVALIALSPYLTDDLLAGEPNAVAAIDQAGNELLVHGQVDHIKIWTRDGTVVWSDEDELIGRSFELDYDEADFFETFDARASVSDLSEAENVYDAETADRLLEVYLGTRTADGTPILVETYSSYELVEQRAAALRDAFIRPMTIVLALLALGQILLVWVTGRRLARSEIRRAEVLERMIRTSDAERRRVAAQVHDGVVQDLMGITFALSGAAQAGHADERELRDLAVSTRGAVGALRGLLSSIYPVDVPPGGWVSGLDEVVAELRSRGTTVDFDVEIDGDNLSSVEELLVLRIAREALRNASKHSQATNLLVELAADQDTVSLTIRDNGVGFDPASRPEGHLGLRLLTDLVADAGGWLAIESNPDAGTTVSFEMGRTR
jgi:two-component system, NarL family, sensor kinase